MKIKVKAKVQVEVEKTIEAPSLEDGLAQARKLGFKDLLWVGRQTEYWPDSVKIDIKRITDGGRR